MKRIKLFEEINLDDDFEWMEEEKYSPPDYVCVVTNPELGWDCVVGVFSTKQKAIEYLKDVMELDEKEDLERDFVFHKIRFNH